MEFSFYGHAFFYYIRVFLFHDGGTIIGIYLLDHYCPKKLPHRFS